MLGFESEEFWAGWALAYSQWRDNLRFRDLLSALPINQVEALASALGCPIEALARQGEKTSPVANDPLLEEGINKAIFAVQRR